MSRLPLLAAVLLPLVAPALASAQPGRRGGESGFEYGWLASYEAGLAAARRSGKPLMVVFRCIP